MLIGNRNFDTVNHCYVAGILNVTPDSFYDGGKWANSDQALFHVEKMIQDGADIIDIGGESTKPGYSAISAEEETERVAPIIESVRARFDVPISLDTCKSAVALAGIKAGADMINDIWGLKFDDKMAEVIASNHKTCCLMHNRKDSHYQNLIKDILKDLEKTLEIAQRAGIPYSDICVDPGIGFAKKYEENLEILNKLQNFHTFGLPIMLGTSRKSVIGQALDLPVEERLEGTLATTVIGVMKGVSFIRVHDVKENVRAVKMTEAVIRGREMQKYG